MDRHYALARQAILGALTPYTGITTDDGATPANNTLICADLKDRNDFITGKTILIGSGDGEWEDSGAFSFHAPTGTITVVTPFSAQIKKGTIFRILNISTVEIDVETIKTQTDKLAGRAPVSNTVTADWESDTGTSGEPGADLVTFGANDTKNKIHSLLVNISALTPGATITVKLFMQVFGTERKVYEQPFTQGTDPDGLWIVNGTIGIHEAVRVEVESNNAGDNDKAVDYNYMLEAM